MAATANWLTFTISKLDLVCNSKTIGAGTGFYLKHDGAWYIATNWHVLSGRNPADGQPRHVGGAIPDHCIYHTAHSEPGRIAWKAHAFALGDALSGSATWLQHPTEGQGVDVAVFRLPDDEVGAAKDLLAPDGHDDQMYLDIGAEVFLPGYPLGLTGGGGMPIWKRASLATSLDFGEGIGRRVLVDTASREGMSGSPCLALCNWQYYRKDPSSMKMTIVKQPLTCRLVGVYSGRLNASDQLEAQLGMVWHKNLIMETMANGAPATVTITP
jgi:hypothetical protein